MKKRAQDILANLHNEESQMQKRRVESDTVAKHVLDPEVSYFWRSCSRYHPTTLFVTCRIAIVKSSSPLSSDDIKLLQHDLKQY